MGGLLAARVASDYFDEVTLLDRDVFPEIGQQRRGVPQAVHTHGLLASGRRVIAELFPGIVEELMERGGLSGDLLNDSRWFFEGGCLSKTNSGLQGILVSRPLLEGVVRKRTFAVQNIRHRESCVVDGLATNAERNRVTGVKTGGETMAADLTIDATGRGSHSPAWLDAIGYGKPAEEKVEIALAYTTRWFKRKLEHLDGDSAAVIPQTPAGKRGGVMLAQEGDRWTCTLVGYHGNVAPSEMAGYVEYAKSLPAPYIYDVVKSAEPMGEAFTARFPASQRRRYERMKSFPEGFLVAGDAICSFNPIYGQGMSVAAQQSLALRDSLAEGGADLARRFFARAAKVVDIPWGVAVGADLRIPETVGPRNAGVNFINWYIARLHKVAHSDPAASIAFLKVANLLAAPPSILAPKMAMKVLFWRG